MLAKVAKFRQIWSHCLDSKQPTLLKIHAFCLRHKTVRISLAGL